MSSVFVPFVHLHYDSTEPLNPDGSYADDRAPVQAFATFEEAVAVANTADSRYATGLVLEVKLP